MDMNGSFEDILFCLPLSDNLSDTKIFRRIAGHRGSWCSFVVLSIDLQRICINVYPS